MNDFRTNAGFVITNSISVGNAEFVLGVNMKNPDSWITALCVAVSALIGEIIWHKCDRRKFTTMMICYSLVMLGWYIGAFVPLILMKDMYLAALPTMADFYSQVFDLVSGPLFFVALVETVIGSVIGSFLGKVVLKKHFQKAGIV